MAVDVDEVWAYRARRVDDLTPVRVLRRGIRKPPRVLVRFEDPSLEGLEQWVPPTRLKIRWDQADVFQAEQAQWSALEVLAPHRDSVEVRAASQVVELVVKKDVAELAPDGSHLTIHDLEALSDVSGMPVAALIGHPDTLCRASDTIVPWPTALTLARALAQRHPAPILTSIDSEEARHRYEAVHGRHYPSRGAGNDWHISPETVRAIDTTAEQPRRALLKQWCGNIAVTQWGEVQGLRHTIRQISGVAEKAIQALHTAGATRTANQLTRELDSIYSHNGLDRS